MSAAQGWSWATPVAYLKVKLHSTIFWEMVKFLDRRRTLKSTLHSTIFWEMVKFVDLGVLYVSLVLPRQSRWTSAGPEWTLRALGGTIVQRDPKLNSKKNGAQLDHRDDIFSRSQPEVRLVVGALFTAQTRCSRMRETGSIFVFSGGKRSRFLFSRILFLMTVGRS